MSLEITPAEAEVDIVRTWATAQTFDSGTIISLPLSGGLAADDAVLPVFNSRLELADSTNRFARIVDTGSNTGSGFHMDLALPTAGLTGNAIAIMPAVVGSLILVGTGELATLSNKTLSGTGNFIRCSTSNTRFGNGSSTTQYMTYDLGSLTAARSFQWPNIAGTVLISEAVMFHNDELVVFDDDAVVLITGA